VDNSPKWFGGDLEVRARGVSKEVAFREEQEGLRAENSTNEFRGYSEPLAGRQLFLRANPFPYTSMVFKIKKLRRTRLPGFWE
jgi:hypothetical protein